MGLYAVAAPKGSPGVTTTAMAVTLAWGGPAVLADVDPSGGDVALRYRSPDGNPLNPDTGLVSLAASVRRGSDGGGVGSHLQVVTGGVPVLVGVSRPEQVAGLGASWQHVSHSLAAYAGHDVVADCGRVLPGSASLPVLTGADAVLLVTRPTLEELYHLRERLRELTAPLRLRELDGVPVGVAVLAPDRDRTSASDVQKVLDAAGLAATVVGVLAYEPKAAAALRYAVDGRVGRSLLLRSAGAIAASLRELTAVRARRLA